MSLLILPDKRILQPSDSRVGVKKELAASAAFSFTNRKNLAGSSELSNGPTAPTLSRTAYGGTLKFAGGSDNSYAALPAANHLKGNAGTIIVVHQAYTASGNGDVFIQKADNTSPGNNGVVLFAYQNTIGFGMRNATQNSNPIAISSAKHIGRPFTTVFSYEGKTAGSMMYLAGSGGVLATVAAPFTWNFTGSASIRLGNSVNTYWGNFPGHLYGLFILERFLPISEGLDIANNPWQLFEDREVPFYFGTGTSGGTTYDTSITLVTSLASVNTTILNTQANIDIAKTVNLVDVNTINSQAEITLGKTLETVTAGGLNIDSTVLFEISKNLSTDSVLQATGAIEVSLSLGETLGVAASSQVVANSACAIDTKVELTPASNLHTTGACNFNVVSSVIANGGFNIVEAITLQSSANIASDVKLEIAGTVSLTSALGQAITQNAIVNGELSLTTAIAENIVTTLLTQDALGIGFEILATVSGTNPAVLARIGTQEILFTIATSRLHFINSGKDILFTSS